MARSLKMPLLRLGREKVGLALPALAFVIFFFVLPLIGNGVGSFFPDEGAFSLELYRRLLTDPFYLKILFETLKVSVIVTVLCVVTGYPIAYFLVRKANRSQALIVFLLLAPLLTSVIMRTFGWQVFFARNGLISVALVDLGILDRKVDLLRNPVSVYVGLVHILVTYMVLSISSVLQSIDTRYEEAAQILGANRWRAFWNITLPLSLDGIATGAVLVFMLCNGSFLTMLLLGGGKVVTLPLLIYQQFTVSQDLSLASAMSNVLMFMAILVMVLQLAFLKRRGV
ncbi:ABC transporter permease [Martelella soudanensis]|uniref:ABC transporter permease n=1 Tax=unclassified Martelella TaxID=2629616 RepID=UPI0015DE004E|nr:MULTISPECIES: ABC transporter permease [unclassified Martelella]